MANLFMPKFSIIIPVYNVAPYLRECLDSVLAQTFTDWEAICVDDGSTDGSGAILDEYAARDSRFMVFHKENGGVSSARNLALNNVSGEWVLFLDADDLLSVHTLSLCESISKDNSLPKLIQFGYLKFEAKNGRLFEKNESLEVETKDVSKEIPYEDFYTFLWQYAIHRSLVSDLKFKKYIRGEDRVFLSEILLNRVDSFVRIADALYGYRQRSTSAVHVAPSCQVILDEMDHRIDILRMIERGCKNVNVSGSSWLEVYFVSRVGALIMRQDKKLRKLLWYALYNNMRVMKDFKCISLNARFVYRVCCSLPFRSVWWVVCCFIPWYNNKGIIPRGIRKIKHCVCKAV